MRPYNRTAGVLGRVKPLQNFKPGEGWGAWELAARYSYIDLNDNPINGGRLGTITGGINWYLNPNTKFQFNYVHAMVAHPGVGNGNGRADAIVVRAQVDF